MYNCLKMPTSRFRKLLASLFVFAGLCTGAWAAEYYWIGGGANNNWSTVENWSTTEGDTPGTGTACPGAGDIAHIYGTVTVIINTDVSISQLLISSGTNPLTSNFTTTLSGSGSLTVTDTAATAINITRCSSTNGVIGTLALNLPVTCAGEIQTHSGTTLEINNELTTENLVHSAYGDTPKTLLKVNGTLTVNDTLNLNAMSGGATQLNVQSGKTVNAKKIIFGADDYNNTGVSSAIVNAGTIRVTEEFTIRNIDVTPYTGSGKIQLDGNGAAFTNNYTGGTITITDLECLQSSVIAGSTNFTNITATGLGGNTLTINGSQTVTGDFDLSGSSSSSKLNLADSGSLSLTNPLIADYLNFTGTGPTITSGTAYASNSTGTPDDWIVVSENQHVWNGSTAAWGTAANWLPQSVPDGNSEEVIINTSASSTYPVISSGVTLKSITINAGTVTVNGTGSSLTLAQGTELDTNIKGTGKLILSSGQSFTITGPKEFDINIENSGTLSCTTGAVTFDKTIENKAGSTFSTSVAITATDFIYNSNNNLTFTEAAAIYELSITSTGAVAFSKTLDSTSSVSITAGTLSFGDAVNVKDITMNATTTTSSDITVTGNWTNTGTFTASSPSTVTFTSNTTTYAELHGENTFYDLNLNRCINVFDDNTISNDLTAHKSAQGDYGNIKFASGKTQTVGGKLDFQGIGTGDGQRQSAACITTGGTWYIKCTKTDNNHNLKFVNLSGCNNISPSYSLVALQSRDTGGNTNIDFPGAEYTWVGGTTGHLNDWNWAANWSPASVPGKGSLIIIPNGKDYYPILTAELNLTYSTSYKGKITIAAGTATLSEGKLDLGGQNVTAGEIVNNGRVRLTGATGQTITLTRTNNANSVVEYYEPSPSATITNFAWGQNYEKLEINESAEIHTQLTVANTTTITAVSSKTITLDSTANTFTGNVILGTALSPTGSVTLAANGSITLSENAYAASIDLTTATINIQNVTTSGTQDYNGNTVISSAAAIESTDNNITFAAGKQLSVNAATTITVPANKSINFNSTTTGTAKLTTAGAGTATFTGNVSNLSALETQAVNFNCETLSTTGAQTYNGAATISRTGGSTISSSGGAITFTSGSSITGSTNKLKVETGTDASNSISFAGTVGASGSPFVELEIGTARTTSFAKPVYIATFKDADTSGNISFNDGGTISNDVSFNTTGAVSFTGTTQTAGLSHNIAGSTTTVTGTLNASSVTLKDFVITETANINTSGNQIYNGKVYGGGNLVLNSTSGGGSGTIVFNDEVNAAAPASVLSSLQTTGPVTINTSKIKTSTTQIYNSALYLGSAASVLLEGSAVTFNNPVSDTDAATSLEVNAPLTINSGSSPANITTLGNQQYDSTVSLGIATVLTAQAGTPAANQTVTFKGNVTGTTATGTTLTINANTSIAAADLSVTTNGDQTYNGTTTGSVKLTTTGTGTAIFNDTVNLGSLETQAARINTTSITTASGTQVYNGAVELTENTNLTASSVSFNANVIGSKSLTVSAPLNINCAQITTSGSTQTYNGTVTLLENTSLTASSVTFKENVSGTKSLEVSGPLNVSDNCTAITTTGTTQTYNGSVNLGVSSKFTASQINFKADITDGAVAGSRKTLTVDSALLKSTIASGSASVILGELKVDADTSIQTNSGTTIAFILPLITGTGKTITLASSGSSFTFDRNVEVNPNLVTSAGTTFTASSGIMTFKADLDLTNGTFAANSGTIVLSAANKGTNQAVLKGDKTYNTLILTGPVNIQGNNTISTFTANAATLAGKTISFDAGTSQSVTNMTLQGSGTAILTLNARGTGNWNISCATEPTLQYLSVSNSTNSSNPAKNFVALNSTDAGSNIEWNFPHMPYKWTGGSDTDWTNTANWQNNVVPTKGANVEIATATHYPLLTAALNLNTSLGPTPYNGIITVDSGATFDISNQTVTAGGIVNNGTVRLKGVANQIAITEQISNGDTNVVSTVEYYDVSTTLGATTLAWGTSYKKLIINKPANLDSTALNVSDTTTISAGTGNTISLNNSSNIFAGHVTIGNSAATPTVNAGAVTLNGTNGTGGTNTAIYLENNVLADSLTLNSNVQGGDLTVTGPVTVNTASVSTTGSQTYNNEVSLLTATTLTAGTSVTFNENVSGTDSLTVSAPLNINCAQITTTGNQTYNGAVTLGADTSLSSVGNILFDSTLTGAHTLTLTQASSTTFNGTVQITEIADATTHSGTVTFNAGGTITNAVTFNTTNTVTFGDASTDAIIFTSDLTHAAGDTSITGTLTAANISLGTTSGTTTLIGTINGSQLSTGNLNAQGTITTSGSQSYTGTVDLTDDLSLSSTSTGAEGITFSSTINGAHNLTISTNAGTNGTVFNGTVGTASALATLSVTGPSAINSASITSTDNQTYDGPLSVQANTTLAANAGQLIYLKNTVTGSGTQSLTISNADSQFDGAISSLASLITAASTSFNTNANISSVGTLSTATANINCNSISTSGNQTYGGPATLGTNLSLTSGANILFNSTLTGAYPLTLTQAASTTFNGAVDLTGFADAAAHTGSVTFNAGGTISTATSFNTTQTVTFGNEAADTITFGSSPDYVNLTHTAGPTVINGTLTAADITLADTSGGPVTITTPGLFLLTDGKSLSYTSSFTQNGSGSSVLRGDFGSAGGNGSAAFTHSVQLSASGAASFGTSGDSISITDNLIITGSSAGLAINASTNVNENIVMYSGAVTLAANLTVQKDILILGTSYSETDTTTGITDEYAYTAARPAGWSTGNYNATQLPDRTSLPATNSYSASLESQAGVTVSAGKNFYANHTELKGNSTGQWILKLPDLTNPANGFAEAYFTKVTDCKVICSDNSVDGSKARLITLEDTDSDAEKSTCTNVDFDEFKITSAYTVRDNVICVVFNRPVRYHATTINSLKFNNSSASPECSFTGLYSDPDCQNELNYDTQMSYFYIKAAPQNSASTGAWNTDATGKYSGNPKSSDRFGIHHDTFPSLDFPRSLPSTASSPTISFLITDRWGKRLTNYSRRVPNAAAATAAYGSADSTYNVEDKTGPVLWTVRTGQELHTAYDSDVGETSQHSYDSHNFLEFRYSEPVDIGTITAYNPPADPSKTPNLVENIKVTDSLGAIAGNSSLAAASLTFAGLANFTASSGTALQLFTGSEGNSDKYVNALYRQDEYSVRLSIAGWTDGTVSDYSGNDYKKWPGYIESATQFTGACAHTVAATNNLVKDQQGNYQIEYAANKAEPLVISNSSDQNTSALLPVNPDLYSSWDISSPVFSPLRFSRETAWAVQETSEAIGNTNGSGSTLDRIDFHFFDNTPSYSGDAAEWFTEIGWCLPGSEASKDNLKDSSYTYCADIIGGARQFDSDSSRRTYGGIRFSTKAEIATAFKYSKTVKDAPNTSFANGIAYVYTTIISQLFTGSSAPMRPANDPDGLYLGLGLSDINLPVDTTFSFAYDESQGYLTDLAGNRLRSRVSKTIDRTPPSFDVIMSPVDNNEVFIIFVKKIVTDLSKLQDKIRRNDGTSVQISEANFENLLPHCFRLISIDENGDFEACENNQINTSIPAQFIEKYSNDSFSCFKLTLKNNITIEDVKHHYLQLIIPEGYPEDTRDPLTSNSNSKVTFIMDSLGNYMNVYKAHIISDFAINYVNPLYAYSSDMLDNGQSVMNGLYEEGSWAVHDWNADQQNYGTLPADHPISIVADSKSNPKLRVYLTSTPDEESVSTQFNTDFGTEFRIWLPDLTDGLFRALSATNNKNYAYADGSSLEEDSANTIFNIPKETVSSWKSGDQITFMFGLMEDGKNPVRIYSNPYFDIETGKFNFALSKSEPLYSLRMTDISDISSLDLWSFKLKGITNQRGGVTILNNVINAEKGEKTVVKVDVEEAGRLNVCVMTLDGNIISYLNRGKVDAGEHYFSWNGKNKNGSPVARGMYFVRVTGTGIDETRKVMVVK